MRLTSGSPDISCALCFTGAISGLRGSCLTAALTVITIFMICVWEASVDAAVFAEDDGEPRVWNYNSGPVIGGAAREPLPDHLFKNASCTLNTAGEYQPLRDMHLRRTSRLYFSNPHFLTHHRKFHTAGHETVINGGLSRGTDKGDIPRSDIPIRCRSISICSPSPKQSNPFNPSYNHNNKIELHEERYACTSVPSIGTPGGDI